MTRRGFLESLIKVGVGFSILPSAASYVRNWKGVYVPPELGFYACIEEGPVVIGGKTAWNIEWEDIYVGNKVVPVLKDRNYTFETPTTHNWTEI